MRVLLLNLPQYRLSGGSCAFVGVGLGYLAQILSDLGHEAIVYNADMSIENELNGPDDLYWYYESDDVHVRNLEEQAFVDEIVQKAQGFDVVGMYLYSTNVEYAKMLARYLDQRIIVGGAHCRLFPGDPDLEFAHAVCATEGEDVIERALYEDGILSGSNRCASMSPVVQPGVLEGDLSLMLNVEVSRGCPFSCFFCASRSIQRRVTKRNPEFVSEELRLRKRLDISRVQIVDEMFGTVPSVFEDVCVPEGMSFVVDSRVDGVNDTVLQRFVEFGVEEVKLGIEYGVQRQLDAVGKRIDLEGIRKAVSLCKSYGLRVRAYHILGSPGGGEDEYLRGMDFIESLDVDWVSTSVLMPFRGTRLYNMVELTEELELQMAQGRFLTPEWYRFWGITDRVLHRCSQLNYKKQYFFSQATSTQ